MWNSNIFVQVWTRIAVSIPTTVSIAPRTPFLVSMTRKSCWCYVYSWRPDRNIILKSVFNTETIPDLDMETCLSHFISWLCLSIQPHFQNVFPASHYLLTCFIFIFSYIFYSISFGYCTIFCLIFFCFCF